MEMEWKQLGVSEALCKALALQGARKPTEIQKALFAPVFAGKDVVAQSETGTGKTLAYLLPVLMRINLLERKTQAVILTPTHELAAQVHRQVQLLAKNSGLEIRSALLIGGAGMARQIEALKEKPQIVVGSSGRILDLIKRRKVTAHTVRTIVVDEADRMLDRWNTESLEAVIKTTLRERQLVFLSASMDAGCRALSEKMMKTPEYIQAGIGTMPENIRHLAIFCEKREKIEMIRKVLHAEKAEKAMVFLNNPENIEVTVEKLRYHGVSAAAIYGGVHKLDRRNVLEDFRRGKVSVLVASDIGARGLDIPGVTHIINLDIPEDPVLYLHRAGRTGRMQEPGCVISLVTAYEERFVSKYQKALSFQMDWRKPAFGKLVATKTLGERTKKRAAPLSGRKPPREDDTNRSAHIGRKAEKLSKKAKKAKN